MPHPLPDALLDQVAHQLVVLGQPLRIRMIERLELEGEMGVQALADALDATQQNVSRHLALLYEADVVDRRQVGRHVLYRVVDETAVSLLDVASARVMDRAARAA